MATKKLKGITIEIDGNTTGLSNALKKVNSQIIGVNSELKEVNRLLKLDPGNAELLAQKHELLSVAIKDTTEKLNTLKEAKKQADEDIASGKETENASNLRELEREIIATEQNLKKLTNEYDNNEKAMDSNSNGIKDFAKEEEKASQSTIKLGDLIKANLISSAIKTGIKGLVNSIKGLNSALGEWSEMSNTLKEQEAKVTQVMKNTIGASDAEIKSIIDLTAKQEKLGVVSQETQLAGLQELGTYVEKKESLEKLLPVMNDMIAQQYGVNASMESASSIATMMGKVLGNGQVSALSKLGYKFDETQEKVLKFGTEEEKAAMLTEVISQSVGGMNEALAQTDPGKVKLINSYLDDMKKGIGSLISDVKNKIIGQFLPAVKKISKAISEIISGDISIEDGINKIVEGLEEGISQIEEMLPKIMETGMKILTKIIDGIVSSLPQLMPTIVMVIDTLINDIVQLLPKILDAGIKILLELIKGIAQSLPKLVPAIVDAIILIVETIIDNIDLIIDAGIDIIMGLIDGIIEALPRLIEKIPVIIEKLTLAIIRNYPKILDAGIKLIIKLAEGLIKGIPDLIAKVPDIIKELVDNLKEGVKDMVNVGKDLMAGLWEGLKSKWQSLKSKVSDFGKGIVNFFKDVFGIHSPSKVMREQIGKNLGLGLVEGIKSTTMDVENAMKTLSNRVEMSVNPVINPTANSNPLYVSIDKFYNNRETSIQQLAEELEFYRKNTALAKGGM